MCRNKNPVIIIEQKKIRNRRTICSLQFLDIYKEWKRQETQIPMWFTSNNDIFEGFVFLLLILILFASAVGANKRMCVRFVGGVGDQHTHTHTTRRSDKKKERWKQADNIYRTKQLHPPSNETKQCMNEQEKCTWRGFQRSHYCYFPSNVNMAGGIGSDIALI